MDSSRRFVVPGRAAAVALSILTGLLAVFSLGGGMFLPVGILLVALLLKWPGNRPTLLVSGLVAGLFVIQAAVVLMIAITHEEYLGFILGGLLLLMMSIATAVASFAALVIRMRQPKQQSGW
jgi:hypothetical protein